MPDAQAVVSARDRLPEKPNLEELRAAGYTAAAISTSSDTVSETGESTGVTPFTRIWTVANGSISGTKNLTITVAWSDQLGSHQVQLRSILAE